jgi:hypothetical protein
MKNVVILINLLVIVAAVTSGCSGYSNKTETPLPTANCPPLPEGFTESDLVGTWVSVYGDGDIDTLVVMQNGKYKQTFKTSTPQYNIESDWKKYTIERRPSGYLWVHFEGMQRCDDVRSLCARPGGGLDPNSLGTIDYCEEVGVKMTKEVILVVTGDGNNAPKGIVLRQMRLVGSDWSYVFKLEK